MSKVHASFQAVEKSYDGISLVVKRLDLDVYEGEFLTMLGPSGSGKTTCLMMLAGFETVTHGEILIHGKSVSRIPPHKRGIGMVFQNYALFPHMTVRENLAFPLQVRKTPSAEVEVKIKRALEMVCLEGFVDRYPGQLSGGQQQRIAVARALVFNPDLILMDEPLGALDKNLREQMQYELKHIHEKLGVTVVYVTHDQTEALTMSDRIAVFNHGIIQQLATPDDLYERPQNSFVAQFIGENNRLLGTVKEVNSDHCQVDVNGSMVLATPVNIKKDEKTILSLRPERIAVLTEKNKGTYSNEYQALLEEKIYLGDHLRLRFSLLGYDEFIIKVPNSGHFSDIKIGSNLNVGWHHKECHALDASLDAS